MMKNEVGVIVGMKEEGEILRTVADFGLGICQLSCWNPDVFTEKRAAAIKEEMSATGVKVNSLWAGYPGPSVWNFSEGPEILGLIPQQYRQMRIDALKKGGDFAKQLGLPAIATHLGFIPENPKNPVFDEVVDAVKDIAEHLKAMDLQFWFETGQETPTTLRRLIERVGTGNLGVNLDPANLILYGKGNPIDALDVFGEYVYSVHAKDGMYPTDPMKLGSEVKVGTGKVRFPEFVKALDAIGYEGAYIIEREISGEQKAKDIRETVDYLNGLLGN